ncbi:MAG: hypothetical protein HC880_20820, partial [Bacteroidia bacterium]|nr:hypothetical protein [Bacteroidia bacterium]
MTLTATGGFNTKINYVTIEPVENNAVACTPISTLDCDEIAVNLPFSLEFTGLEGGLANTGFTMADPPSARIAADGPITNPDVPGFEPSRLTVANGQLTVNAAKGLAFVFNGTGTGTSTEVNSQINTLGVGFDASLGAFDIQTTIINPYTDSDATNEFEQGGIWFGLDEDNYVKLVAQNGGNVEMRAEEDAVSPNNSQVIVNAVTGLHTNPVTLRLRVDPVAETLTAFYTVGNDTETLLGTIDL